MYVSLETCARKESQEEIRPAHARFQFLVFLLMSEVALCRKAVRATLILFPLLGVTYVVFISPPNDEPMAKRVFVYFNAILQSIQGLAIAVFYCLLNGEVNDEFAVILFVSLTLLPGQRHHQGSLFSMAGISQHRHAIHPRIDSDQRRTNLASR